MDIAVLTQPLTHCIFYHILLDYGNDLWNDSALSEMDYTLSIETNYAPHLLLKKVLLVFAIVIAGSFVIGIALSFCCFVMLSMSLVFETPCTFCWRFVILYIPSIDMMSLDVLSIDALSICVL